MGSQTTPAAYYTNYQKASSRATANASTSLFMPVLTNSGMSVGEVMPGRSALDQQQGHCI
jgi:hypothetical protein